jgi:hypothetical protein
MISVIEAGARVRMTESFDRAAKDMVGTIKGRSGYLHRGHELLWAVEFDEPFQGGHNCDGLTMSDRGHFVAESYLEPHEPAAIPLVQAEET